MFLKGMSGGQHERNFKGKGIIAYTCTSLIEKKRNPTQAAKHSLHQLRKR
jgi:hypothetical protein